MNKAELIEAVAKDAEISRSKASCAVDAFIDSVSKSLKKGQKVTLVGFGTFGTSKRKAREGRNPQTGAKIKIPARRVARFKPGKALIAAVR
jgi:DNA-binding protein HU-beta